MQKIKNILSKAVIAVLAATLAAGCVLEKNKPENLRSVTIQLNVSAGEMTKATEDPSVAESEMKTLRILAYSSGRLAGDFYRGSASTEPIFMDLVMPETGVYDVDFYVVANEKSMSLTSDSPVFSNSMTVQQLSAVKFNAISLSEGMPMYGITTVSVDVTKVLPDPNTAQGHYGHQILDYVVPVELTRPVSKLSIYAAKEHDYSGNLVIKDVLLLAKGTRQYNYLLPQETAVLQAIGSRTNDRDLLLSEDIRIATVLSASAQRDVSENYQLLSEGQYISEVPFGSASWDLPVAADVRSMVIEIKYSAGEGTVLKTGYVYLPVIERNTHCKILCSFGSDGNMKIRYDVADWENAEMWDNGLTFDYPTHSFLMPSVTSNEKPSSPATMTYVAGESSGAFIGYFQMLYPENETWDPTLLNTSASDYVVEVWNHEGTDLITDPQNYVSGNVWYMIKVIPRNPDNIGKEVKLAITFQPTWSDQAEYLMINGSQSSLFWPYAGTETTEDPNYVIITQQ